MNQDISVVIPAYNRFERLKITVDSILAQTHRVREVIVVDDGSADETPVMMPHLLADDPAWKGRVRYFRQENQGQSAALNNGIQQVTTEWIGFNAQDDLWLPWKLEWQFRALEKHQGQCGLCFSDAWFMNNPHMKLNLFDFIGKKFSGVLGIVNDPIRLVVDRNPVWVQTCIARTETVRKSGGFDPGLRYSEDHDFLFRMALETKFCYVNMPMVLIDRSPADIRHSGESRNWHKEEFCLRMDQRRFEKQLALCTDMTPDIRETIRKHLRSIHSAWANFYLASGEFQKARKAIDVAAKYDLTPALAFKWAVNRISPKLAMKILSIQDRRSGPRHDRVSWQNEESPEV